MAAARPRQVIDFALARRADLADLFAGRTSPLDACDAHPYLLRAAKHHGEPSTTQCPVCRHADPLTHVTYVYGDALGESSGRPRPTRALPVLAREHGELTVYVVEVCQHCSWNYRIQSYVLGGTRRGASGRSTRATGSASR